MSNPPALNIFKIRHFDKILHLITFATVGAAAALGSKLRKGSLGFSVFLEAWIITCFYGFLDEIHQRCVPSRSPHVADWFADVAGAALGILVFFALSKYFGRSQIPSSH